MEPTPLLIASLGNPRPFENTLHSAGHVVLPQLLQAFEPSALPLSSQSLFSKGLSSSAGPHAFYLPNASMNVLGRPIADAWRSFLGSLRPESRRRARLVLIHDELELRLGLVKVRQGSASARGHNGIKSVSQALGGNMDRVIRIGVGIGRPASRESNVVSDYVLRKMTSNEREALLSVVDDMQGILRTLECGDEGIEKGRSRKAKGN